jgi:hypothetical protein
MALRFAQDAERLQWGSGYTTAVGCSPGRRALSCPEAGH